MNRKPIRQGDVWLLPVANIPTDATPVTAPGPLVLAEGETSGHSHVVTFPQPHPWAQRDDGRWATTGAPAHYDTAAPDGVTLYRAPGDAGLADRFLRVLTDGGVMLPVVRPDGTDAGRHAPVHVAGGDWIVRTQRRFDAGQARRVVD